MPRACGVNETATPSFKRRIAAKGTTAPLERFPIGWIHTIERKTLQINKLERVLTNENSDISEF